MNRTNYKFDQFGQPVKQSDISKLNEPQTAHLASLHRTFATHPTRGLTPSRLHSILESAEQGDILSQHDLFCDMEEKDGHIMAEMSKRRRALLGLEWSIIPPRNPSADEERLAEEVKEWLQDIPDIEDVVLDMADGIGHGFANLEMEWDFYGKIRLPSDIEHRPQSWFQLDRKTRTQLLLRDDTPEGEALQPFTWICHTHRARSGYLTRAGLHRTLAWPYLFKNYSVMDLAELLEIYGLPLRLGKYQTNATPEEKATLMRAVVGMGHNAAGIIPEGMLIEFQQAATGSQEPFEAMIGWCERTQSKVILGATLTSQTDSGSGAYALGSVHNEVRKDLRDSDCKQIAGTLSRDLIYPILALNGRIKDPRRLPKFKFETDDPEDLDAKVNRDKTIYDMGFEPTEEYISETYGEGWVKRAPSEPAMPPADSQEEAAAKAKAEAPDLVDTYTRQLQDATSPAIEQIVNQVRQLLDEAETLEEVQDRLLDLYSHLAPDELADVMQLGLQVWGTRWSLLNQQMVSGRKRRSYMEMPQFNGLMTPFQPYKRYMN